MDYEDDAQEPFLHHKDEEMNIDIEIQSKIREGFIYKVFGIVLYQILILFLLVFLGLGYFVILRSRTCGSTNNNAYSIPLLA